jgi:hypothetical protein
VNSCFTFLTVFVGAAAATAEGFSAGVAGTENVLLELLIQINTVSIKMGEN